MLVRGCKLDPRTKMVMVFVVGVVLTAGGYGGLMTYVRPALAFMPLLLLMLSKRWGAEVFYAVAFSAAYWSEIFLVSRTFGILNFILLASVWIPRARLRSDRKNSVCRKKKSSPHRYCVAGNERKASAWAQYLQAFRRAKAENRLRVRSGASPGNLCVG
jgi:predicted membrane protein